MRTAIAVSLVLCASSPLAAAAGAGQPTTQPACTMKIIAPVAYQVVQREGFDPRQAHHNAAGGPALGHADVAVTLAGAAGEPKLEWRLVRLKDAFGKDTDWAPLAVTRDGENWTGRAKTPAGGWYRLEVRSGAAGAAAAAAVEPFGVGELFVVAGQSYAEGCNDELLKVQDPHGRVVAYDMKGRSWQIAHDPQPGTPHRNGTIWPPMGDALLPLLRVPVGFVNVAVAATASAQWMPGKDLYKRLDQAGLELGRFRAVLWQQGESDLMAKVTAEKYVENIVAIRQGLAKSWGFEPVWLPAKSTLHPTVYNDPAGEERIRGAIDGLWSMPGFGPGPDTDILGGENRGGPKSQRHFTGVGQRRAGLLWAIAAWNEIHRQR